MPKTIWRIICGIVLFLGAVTTPPLVTVFLVLFFTILFRNYYEALFAGLLIDSIFATERVFATGYGFFYTILFGVMLMTIAVLRPRLRW